jgi:heptosyltransferase-2
VAPAWVGDAVMAHALLRVLAEDDAALHLEVVAPPATAPLFERMAEVAAVHLLDVGHGELGLRRRFRLGRRLAGLGFERAIVLPNSFKSALVALFAGIPRRTGFVGEARRGFLNDARRLDADDLPRMVDRFVALARETGAPFRPAPRPLLVRDADAAAGLRSRLGLAGDGPVLACAPGAEYGPAKRWPAAHFATLLARRLPVGGAAWLLGGPGDAEITARIRAALPADAAVHDLAGRTTLTEAIDLLGEADAVVTNDSGLMHVACALERPVLALYGSTSTVFTPPLGKRVRTLSLDLACAPCFRRECPLGHLACLRDLTPDAVNAALDELLAEAA